MAGRSRPKDGVASAGLCPAIYVFLAAIPVETSMPGTSPGIAILVITSSRRRDQRSHRHVQDVNEPGRIVSQFNLALQLLPQRSHQTGSKALSGGSMDRWTILLGPRQAQSQRLFIDLPFDLD